MSNSHINRLKLKLSSNFVGHSNDENNFPHKLLLTNTHVLKLRQTFAYKSSATIKLSKSQLRKMGQSGGFLGRPLGLLLKTGLPLIGNLLKPLGESVLIPLGLTAATSKTNAAIYKKMFGSGVTKLIIWNEEMNDIMKIFKSLKKNLFI